MGIFMDREIARKHGFKMTKLERPLKVKNVDGTENSGGSIAYQAEVNIFYKNHVERIRMDVCNFRKTEVILGIPWLQAHNPEINWETKEVSQLCYGLVVTYCIVYHYTKRATLARLLANEGPAIYVVYLNRYFVIPL